MSIRRGRGRPFGSTKVAVAMKENEKTTSLRLQCCVICYNEFTPFSSNSEKWDSNMIKNFYVSLAISSTLGSNEDDDEVLSLPFCPQCHTKVSVMAAYQMELQNISSKFNSIRNDLAFTVVKTIEKNSKDGPMDYIRQLINNKWKMTYEEEEKNKNEHVGLDYIVMNPSATAPHHCGTFICNCGNSEKDSVDGMKSNCKVNGSDEDEDEFKNLPILSPAKAKSPDKGNLSLSIFTNSKNRKFFTTERSRKQSLPALPHRKSDFSHVKPTVASHIVSKISRKSTSFRMLEDSRRFKQNLIDKFNKTGSNSDSDRKRKASTEIEIYSKTPLKMSRGSESKDNKISSRSRSGSRSPLKSGSRASPFTSDSDYFNCSMCPKVYYNKSRLLRHESTVHPETKAFLCDTDHCNMGFSSHMAYKRHMLQKHKISLSGAEIFKCPVLDCNKSFLKKEYIAFHVKIFHKGADTDLLSQPVELSEDDSTDKNDEEIAKIKAELNKLDSDMNNIEMSSKEKVTSENSKSPTPRIRKKVNFSKPFGARRRKKVVKKDFEESAESSERPSRNRGAKPIVERVEPTRKSTRRRNPILELENKEEIDEKEAEVKSDKNEPMDEIDSSAKEVLNIDSKLDNENESSPETKAIGVENEVLNNVAVVEEVAKEESRPDVKTKITPNSPLTANITNGDEGKGKTNEIDTETKIVDEKHEDLNTTFIVATQDN